MSLSPEHIYYGRNGAAGVNFSRKAQQQPSGDRLRAQGRHFESFDHGQEDQDSAPSTPSLTTASSRSGPSSVCACESCGYPNQLCRCREASDSSSLDFRNSDSESPLMSPISLPCQKRDTMRFPKSLFQGQVTMSSQRSTSVKSSFSQFQCESSKCSIPFQPCHPRIEDEASLQDKGFGITCQAHNDFESDESDEDDFVAEDEEERDDDWSGQDTSLESVILEALGGDLVLAAQLIPVLHKSFYCEFAADITRKVAPWANGITKFSEGGSPAQTSFPVEPESQSSNPRKRQRRFGSGNHNSREQDDDEDDEDEDEKDPNSFGNGPENIAASPVLRLACPFYKRDPAKYCIQHDATDNTKRINYRTCEGPGFNSIQRLKEHLKRKHYPVQCDRCYQIFLGSDRADCVLQLQSHRQLKIPCQRAEAALKEGISDAQWASLDKKKSSKKNQATSRVEKYWEIWDILFPKVARPKTPWYDTRKSSSSPPPFSRESSEFSTLFTRMLELQVQQEHIRFPSGLETEMMLKVQSLVQKAFSLYVGIHGLPQSEKSSSSGSKSMSRPQSSVFSGSYVTPSTPRTSESLHTGSPSVGRSSGVGMSGRYELGMNGTSSGNPVISDSREQRNAMAPPFMGVPQMLPSQFVGNSMGPAMQGQSRTGFPVELQNMGGFVPNTFSGNGNGNTVGAWGYMPFASQNAGFSGNANVDGQYGNQLQQTLFDASDEGAQGLSDWEQGGIQFSRG